MTFGPRGPLRGTAAAPGDKSISHRALMLAAMAGGRSRIEGLSKGEDVGATAGALRAMGVRIERDGAGWAVDGVGTGALLQPQAPLDFGNSGTSARLLMGLIASHPITATLIGDASLSRRPMDRVTRPLARVGANFAGPATTLPLAIRGISPAAPFTFRLDVASAQVKSALLLAGLNIPGIIRVIEPVPTRDHTERMLKLFGADIRIEEQEGERHISIRGEATLTPQAIRVPGDVSSAAFLIVAALVIPGSSLRLENLGVNPMRTGLFEMLQRMGADLHLANPREQCGEPVADIEVRHSPLTAIDVPPQIVPAMIDEFPIFFIAAAFADGVTRTRGLAELRLKESDRVAAMAAGLEAIGVSVEVGTEGLAVHGSAGRPLPGGAVIASCLDHRVAMGFAVAGLHADEPITVDDMSPVATSFPGFAAALSALTS